MRGIRGAIFAKMKRSRKGESNKEILSAKLKQIQQHIHDWPSMNKKRNHPNELRSGEDILGELDGVVNIIGYYLSQMYDANDRKKHTLIGKVEECLIKTKSTSKLLKKLRICHIKILFIFAVQIICNSQLLNHCVFDLIHSKVSE